MLHNSVAMCIYNIMASGYYDVETLGFLPSPTLILTIKGMKGRLKGVVGGRVVCVCARVCARVCEREGGCVCTRNISFHKGNISTIPLS
jgi:hypothetical protein